MHHDRATALVALSTCWGAVVLYARPAGPFWAGTPGPTVLIAADDTHQPPEAGAVETHPVADLTVTEALRLDGKRGRFQVIVRSGEGVVEDARVFEVGFGSRDDLCSMPGGSNCRRRPHYFLSPPRHPPDRKRKGCSFACHRPAENWATAGWENLVRTFLLDGCLTPQSRNEAPADLRLGKIGLMSHP
jgi:hypothetical protein